MRYTRLLVFLVLLPTPALLAQDLGEDGQVVFGYGDSCGQLAQLTRQEIASVSHPVHAEHFAQFCSPDGVYGCADYNSLLEGAGNLEDSSQGQCRFVPL